MDLLRTRDGGAWKAGPSSIHPFTNGSHNNFLTRQESCTYTRRSARLPMMDVDFLSMLEAQIT